jgi:hypothetical protein
MLAGASPLRSPSPSPSFLLPPLSPIPKGIRWNTSSTPLSFPGPPCRLRPRGREWTARETAGSLAVQHPWVHRPLEPVLADPENPEPRMRMGVNAQTYGGRFAAFGAPKPSLGRRSSPGPAGQTACPWAAESRRWSHRKPRWSGVIAGIPGKASPSMDRDPRYKNPPKEHSGPSRSTYPVA